MQRPRPKRRRPLRPVSAYDLAIVSLVVWSCVRPAEAWAIDEGALITVLREADFELATIPPRFSLPLAEQKSFPSEFRSRGPSIVSEDATSGPEDKTQHGSVWQRLGEFRTHDRLRLLTLWRTGGHSLSLQAGRRGDPTLQWTTGLSHRGADSGCLLDELFSSSAGGALGKGLHMLPHFPPVEFPTKPARAAEAPLTAPTPGK
jgi:hypothetical protein